MARLYYFFARAWRHMRRSPVVTGVTVGTVAIVFLVLGAFALVGHNLERLGDRLQTGWRFTAYLTEDASSEQVEAVRRLLSESSQVAEVAFVSRKEALERFRARLGSRAGMLDGLEANPLPASLEATFSPSGRTSSAASDLAQAVVALPGVDQVQYGQAWLERFFSFTNLARMAGLVIGSLIIFATLLIVSNTIRLSVYARREEIHILKLVGATDRFVQAPFYIEGIVLGALGAGMGLLGTWLLYSLAEPSVQIPLGPSDEMKLAFLPGVALVLIAAAGAVLGLLGTLASLGRHLKI